MTPEQKAEELYPNVYVRDKPVETRMAMSVVKFNRDTFLAGYNYAKQEAWIPVSERLPDEDISVLLTNGKIVFFGSYYGKYFFGSIIPGYGESIKDATHWQPLPTPQKQ